MEALDTLVNFYALPQIFANKRVNYCPFIAYSLESMKFVSEHQLGLIVGRHRRVFALNLSRGASLPP